MQPETQALWLQGQQHVLAGRLADARMAFDALLERHPEQINARLLLASVILAQGRVREAAEQLRRAAEALPDDAGLVCRVAQSLASLGETNAARACLRHPEVARTRSGPALMALGHVCQGLGLHAEALALMDRARECGLDGADFRYFHALQLQFNGRLQEAEAEMESCLRMGPTFGRASLSLARIRRQTPASNHVDFIRKRLGEVVLGSQDHAAFEFALYEELDDLGDLEGAWSALERGNGVMAARRPYTPVSEARLVDLLMGRFDQPCPSMAAPQHDPGPIPIFVIGLPRSGTTLVERILGSHPLVASAGELNDMPRQLRWVADVHGFPLLDEGLLEASRTFDFAMLGRRYLEQTRWRAGQRPYYVDKLPPNFLLLGFIRHALPQARVVHLVRDPIDVCYSNYRAMFGDAYAYSYGLDSLAHYHRQYRRLMDHWHRVMPGFIFDLPYSGLVGDTENAVRCLLQACRLPYDAGCLEHDRNRASVATLSSAQVRQPIHSRGVGEWRRYAAQLEPLRTGLGMSVSG